MGCGGSKHDVVWVSDSLRVRFPTIESYTELLSTVRYGVAKMEQAMASQRGEMKEELLANALDLLISEVASEELKELYATMGGKDNFLIPTIKIICHASYGKNLSSGI